jgi:hypothetical protein
VPEDGQPLALRLEREVGELVGRRWHEQAALGLGLAVGRRARRGRAGLPELHGRQWQWNQGRRARGRGQEERVSGMSGRRRLPPWSGAPAGQHEPGVFVVGSANLDPDLLPHRHPARFPPDRSRRPVSKSIACPGPPRSRSLHARRSSAKPPSFRGWRPPKRPLASTTTRSTHPARTRSSTRCAQSAPLRIQRLDLSARA